MPSTRSASDPVVGPVRRAERRLAERRVAEPARRRRAAGEQAEVQQEPAEREEPVAHRVQAREGHVARADHERHEVVGEADERRHHDEEDHRRAVHREDLVVGVGREEAPVRARELQAHEERLDAADGEEEERRQEVEDADALVIDGRDPGEDRALSCASASPWGGLATGASRGSRRSSERLEVGDEVGHLRVGELRVRHVASRLDRLWVLQPAPRASGVLASTPAPSVVRAARCVRSGAKRASSVPDGPENRWQSTQPSREERPSAPRGASAVGAAGTSCWRSHASNFSGASATTRMRIHACCAPQYSAHVPT